MAEELNLDSLMMSLVDTPEPFKAGCNFCDLAAAEIGAKDSRGAVKVYETGVFRLIEEGVPSPHWYVMLQDNVTADPKTGFRLLLLPSSHLTNFAQIGYDQNMARYFGLAAGVMNLAMQMIRREEWIQNDEGLFVPMARMDGKCSTAVNSKEHLHFKLDEPTGGLAQPFPVDAKYWNTAVDNGELKQVPVLKHTPERMANLTGRLIEYCDHLHQRLYR